MKLKASTILIIIFLLTLIFRLYFAFSIESFSSDESYFHYRLINYIKENKLPMLYDQFSYGGQAIYYPQLFPILMAIFSFCPVFLKIFPALIASCLVIIVYLIAKKITNEDNSSLLTAFLAAFIPIEIHKSVNQISIYPILLIIILLNTESLFISRYKKEAIIFSFFLVLLINFLLYKTLFLQHGLNIIWQNIPDSLFATYFKNLNVLEGIYLIGALPIILGSLGIFFGLFKEKKDSIILLTAAILATLFLVSIKVLSIQIGFLFLSVFLVTISSLTISKIYTYLSLTKFSSFKKYVTYLIIILIIGLAFIPSYFVAKSLPNYDHQVDSFKWIKENTPLTATIVVPLELGNVLTAISDRKNIIDDNFLVSRNAEERFNDVNEIYNTALEIKALEALNKYDANYIYFDDYIADKYKITRLRYVESEKEKCFEVIKNDVYKVVC